MNRTNNPILHIQPDGGNPTRMKLFITGKSVNVDGGMLY